MRQSACVLVVRRRRLVALACALFAGPALAFVPASPSSCWGRARESRAAGAALPWVAPRASAPAALCMAAPRAPRGKAFAGQEATPVMNEDITAAEVRVVLAVAEGDQQLGIMPTGEALQRADELGLDLVMIAKEASPPVVKIIDYGKYKYMSEKKEKDKKKKSSQQELKEVKMSYKIEPHDYQVRLRSALKFIGQGNRVKVIVQFKGREMSHMDLGHKLLERLVTDCEGSVITDGRPKREGGRLTMVIAPKS